MKRVLQSVIKQKIAVTLLRVVRNFKYAKLLDPVCVILFCLSCSKKNETEESLLPPNLKGTKWKLEGIWYGKSEVFRELEPLDCEKCYTLAFDTDTTAHGFVINGVVSLTISEKTITVITHKPDTGGAELVDDEIVLDALHYRHALYAVWNIYSINETEIKLYFADPIDLNGGIEPIFIPKPHNYLLYKNLKH